MCPSVARFSKNVLSARLRHYKKIILEGPRISRWLGRENEETLALTRYCCGWPSSPSLTVKIWCTHIHCNLHMGVQPDKYWGGGGKEVEAIVKQAEEEKISFEDLKVLNCLI